MLHVSVSVWFSGYMLQATWWTWTSLWTRPATKCCWRQFSVSIKLQTIYNSPTNLGLKELNHCSVAYLFSMASMLACSSHSSSVLSCRDDKIRWCPVRHSVPSTTGMKGRCRTTPSTRGVFINSANSIPMSRDSDPKGRHRHRSRYDCITLYTRRKPEMRRIS